MPRSISAPVGQNSPNFPNDVKTIQELINKVPPNDGGLAPDKKLVVDGACGPKTKDAISKFQLKHFGWSGADGKVEPNKQTLAKLNSFDKPAPGGGAPPPPPPPKPQPKSKQFLLQFVNKGNVIGLQRKDRFLLVTLVPTQQQSIYYLGTGAPPLPAPNRFEGVETLMNLSQARTVDELEGVGMLSSKSDGKTARSELVLNIDGQVVRTQMNAHLVEPTSNSQSALGVDMQLIKSGVQIF
jgi:hypothetical protein